VITLVKLGGGYGLVLTSSDTWRLRTQYNAYVLPQLFSSLYKYRQIIQMC